ncbi:MAG: universal stress protein [Cyclobacteriaceae bacterium]|nr:universal stress protein [Cyclobacteriaceae bacterium]
MKKILVPTDFSKEAGIATDLAFDIAKRSGASLILFHVVEEGSTTSSSFNVEGQVRVAGDSGIDRLFMVKLIEKSRKQLQKAVSDPRYSSVQVDGVMRIGNPFHGMKTIIAEQKADLVIMGTAGRTGIEGMVIGSNTEKIIRTSRCPVLTVQKKPATSDFKNIVFATSMSTNEEVFTKILKRTQQIYNSTIHLVRINTPGDFQRDHIVKGYMEKFAKKLLLKNFTLNIFNDLSVEEGVIRFADSVNADMIAMATHGRSGFAHVIAGSVAEDVASHSSRPVLTFVVKR